MLIVWHHSPKNKDRQIKYHENFLTLCEIFYNAPLFPGKEIKVTNLCRIWTLFNNHHNPVDLILGEQMMRSCSIGYRCDDSLWSGVVVGMLSFPLAHANTQTNGTDQNSRQENQKYGRLAVLRIRDVYPGSENSNERQGRKKFVVIPFFGALNFTKLNYFIFEMLKKKIWANFQRL